MLNIHKTNIATFFLILMCVQYIPLEGDTISYIKFGAMCLTPLIWLVYTPKISKAFIFGGLYFLALLISGINNYQSFRLSTVGYSFSFIFMFITYYNLVYCERVFTADKFIKILKFIILLYVGVLAIQQVANIAGIRDLLLINQLGSYAMRGVLAGNSISLETSHSARILTVVILSLLRMYEVKWGRINVTFKAIYKDAKWVVIGFLWAMLTMGSGTAFVGLAILLLYFVKTQYTLTITPILLILYLVTPYIEFEPLQRAMDTFEATLTMDQQTVKEADYSAAARVVPLLNTLTELDLKDSNTWFGRGIDTRVSSEYLSKDQTVGGITDYGLIYYILSLVLVFNCCIRKFLSLETLIFVALMMTSVGNVAYVWGILLIFTTATYFRNQNIMKNNE